MVSRTDATDQLQRTKKQRRANATDSKPECKAFRVLAIRPWLRVVTGSCNVSSVGLSFHYGCWYTILSVNQQLVE